MEFRCVESALKIVFRAYSRLISRFPVPLILLYTLLSIGLGFGIYFMNFESNTEELFSPINSRAKTDRVTVNELFPVDDRNTLPNRLIYFSHRRISVIVTCKDGGNILRKEYVQALLDIDESIRSAFIYSAQNATYFDHTMVCIQWKSQCFPNPVILYYNFVGLENNDTSLVAPVPYPDLTLPDGSVANIEPYFGDVEVQNGEIISASAFSMNYFLQDSPAFANALSKEWETYVMGVIADLDSDSIIDVYGFHSESLDESQRDLALSAIVYVVASFGILVTFAIVSCIMIRDYRQSKPWLGVMGVISATLALVSAVGLLCYCGVPFNQVTISMPFIILGIGLDDMFIMISAWRLTNPSQSVKERMATTYEEAAVSITITSLTDILAFCIGSISPIPAIQIFCLYTGVAVFFAYIYQITYFGAWMVLFGHMEAYNCSGTTCVPLQRIQPMKGPAFVVKHTPPTLESAGTSRSSNSSNTTNSNDNDNVNNSNNIKTKNLKQRNHVVMVFFRDYYSQLFSNKFCLCGIMVLYVFYISIAAFFCSRITLGLQKANIAKEGTMTHDYLTLFAEYFAETGPSISIIITEPYPYWNSSNQEVLETMVAGIHDNENLKPRDYTDFWLDDYKNYLMNMNDTTEIPQEDFVSTLRDIFLKIPHYEKYTLDINFDGNEITSSRFLSVTSNITSTMDDERTMLSVRRFVDEYSEIIGVPIIAYSTQYVFVEQYVVIIPTTIQTLSIAVACMLVVSVVMMPKIAVGILVTISVASILVGVIGYMTLWQVSLESVSMFNLVLCIGFSVDFSAHVAYAFVMSEGAKLNATEKLSRALYLLGYPILQSGWSTIIGIFLLFFSASYIFRTFAKIMTLVMALGMLHGLVFLPAAMTTFAKTFQVPKCQKGGSEKANQGSGTLEVDNSAFSVD